jgi:hypothetical protein
MVYTATLITAKAVIAAKAGIQESTRARPAGGGFRVKPEMTNSIGLMSSCIEALSLVHFVFPKQAIVCH